MKYELWATRKNGTSVMWTEGFSSLVVKNGCEFLKFYTDNLGQAKFIVPQPSFDLSLKKIEEDFKKNPRRNIFNYFIIKTVLLTVSRFIGLIANFTPFFLLIFPFKIFSHYWERFQLYIMVPHATERFFEKELQARFNEDFNLITLSTKPFEYMKLNRDIFRYPIKEITKKYGWVGIYGYLTPPYTEEYFLDYGKKIDKNSAKEAFLLIKKNKNTFNKFLRKLNAKDKSDCRLMNFLVFCRTDRVDVMKKTLFNLYPFLNRVVKTVDDNFDTGVASMLSHKEIIDILSYKNKLSMEELNKRKGNKNVLVTRDAFLTSFKYGLEEINKMESLIAGNFSEIFEIKGIIAQKGIARGVVVLYSKDKASFMDNKNDYILVTQHTEPRDLPFMKKSIAIITDEGGITSHTAVVSRELKIPCIIGTKIATRVLKDGDLVEVNANTGLVKIIKKVNEG